MRARDLLGPWGEAAAAAYLRKKGFRIEAMNYRTRLGEIDIIAADRRYLIFCEVKLRKSADFAAAREFVDSRKQQRPPRFCTYPNTSRSCSRAST